MRSCAREAIWVIAKAASRGGGDGSSLSRGEQELDIALGAGDRARDQPLHRPAARRDPGGGGGADALVHRGIAHDAALADLAALGLELRLDQRDEAAAVPDQLH